MWKDSTYFLFCLQEALLSHQDLGDSLDSVETLKRKHDDLCKSAAAQEEKINSVDEVANRLIERDHYASEEIDSRRNAVCCTKYSMTIKSFVII